jgi:hypothetical protein
LEVLTPAALIGPFGLFDSERTYPLFRVVRTLAALAGRPLRETLSSRPEAVLALADGRSVWVANLTGETQTLRLDGARATLAPYEAAEFP